ncbi:carbohydrate ABC transporter substrate-binding protein, CUT1 family [Actinacidiphila alni]|uniref:Carbohydrate ABC transporter substrate-binding protein, CUT1 family n=1 Tax=Actinacidiphila alni TaxID=380248 RepID=A0A1I2IEC6_9ACTN|nr:extracellular solute-binding protein [Actinacidiphila alni]SFF40752.1 carbohydrate ABC transporter substrate-binding protein, CUT1 family [Actinacidiphila alni]
MASQTGPSRRTFLAAGSAVAAGAAVPLLSSCSTSSATKDTSASDAKAELPTYAPVTAVRPDLPASPQGSMPGYFSYPRNPKPAFPTPPLEGLDEVSIIYPTYSAVPPKPGNNAFWQRLNKGAGADLKITLATGGDYPTKFQTLIAGGDLPDIAGFPVPTPDQPQVMSRLFADLGPYLSGDAAKEFPYLANIPTASWKTAVANGTIYAVPQPRALPSNPLFARVDLIQQLGANPEPKSYQEFLQLMKDVTDPKKSRWAFADVWGMVTHLQMMLGAPNVWDNSTGTFTSTWADERTKQALGMVRDMVKQGLFHPDAASATAQFTPLREYFTSGRTVMTSDGYAAWDIFGQQIGYDKVTAMVEPKHDGGGDARHFGGTGSQGLTVIRKGLGEKKTRALVNLLNWLCAPIGTQEHLYRKFGVEGTDFTWKDGMPTLTAKGSRELVDVQYITDAPTILGPGQKATVTTQHAWHTRVTAGLLPNPAVGRYSDTNSRKGSQLKKITDDAQLDIAFGRQPLSHWDDVVKQWRSTGGDKMAAEYSRSTA